MREKIIVFRAGIRDATVQERCIHEAEPLRDIGIGFEVHFLEQNDAR